MLQTKIQVLPYAGQIPSPSRSQSDVSEINCVRRETRRNTQIQFVGKMQIS